MASFIFVAYCFAAIGDWNWLVVNFMALRSYAASQALPPAHAWMPFGQIWRDKEHRMRPCLVGLLTSTAIFMACCGTGALIGYFTFPPATNYPSR